jgi:hypothetical protein
MSMDYKKGKFGASKNNLSLLKYKALAKNMSLPSVRSAYKGLDV